MSETTTRFPYARILVVDDSVLDRMIISTALKKAGFTNVQLADDGSMALQKTRDFRPDLVLLDLAMPKLDGFGYCGAVRQDPAFPRMPIIVQSISEDRQSRLKALACGADDFLTKPLDMAELTLRICVHVERFFMLREMLNMCTYLRMELDVVKGVQRDINVSQIPFSDAKNLERHVEVLEQLAHLSSDQA
ncbi:MAG: response regulator [Alphaproteobacteria bacterium]|nr:response regulator [Alphaproteobacteria bacterium]